MQQVTAPEAMAKNTDYPICHVSCLVSLQIASGRPRDMKSYQRALQSTVQSLLSTASQPLFQVVLLLCRPNVSDHSRCLRIRNSPLIR